MNQPMRAVPEFAGRPRARTRDHFLKPSRDLRIALASSAETLAAAWRSRAQRQTFGDVRVKGGAGR
eukprot:1220345-Alexandrium_andersonii.AAC.1